MMRVSQWIQATLVIGAVASCSLAVNADRQQCSSAADCVTGTLGANAICVSNVCTLPAASADSGAVDAPAEDPTWSCIGNVKLPAINKDAPIRFQWKFVAGLTEAPIAGMNWFLCTPQDVLCTEPVLSGVTDDNGFLDAELYVGFRGYFNLRPSPTADIIPSLMYFKPPSADVLYATPETYVHLFREVDFIPLASIVGTEVNREAGHIFGFAFDCLERPAAKVRTRLDSSLADTTAYYSDGNRTPSKNQEETSPYAEAGFVNAPPGVRTMTYSLSDTGRRIGLISFIVRKGEITYAPMSPSPL